MLARIAAGIVFSLVVLSAPVVGNAVIPTAERSNLISLYSSTNGNHWYLNTNWCVGSCPSTGTPVFNAPGTECTWYGVTCDSTATRVLGIKLSKNHLAGQIPEFSGFTYLHYFDGSVNQLTGKIPDLGSLQGFDVHNNDLTGEIPVLAANFQYFDASSNQLTGKIPELGGLTGLQGFDVHNNHLTGSIPILAGLTKLKIFDVSSNQLTGKIPDLAHLVSLQSFLVGNNKLSGSVPAAPTSMMLASLCPNPLTIASQPDIDLAWNKATGDTPWWSKSFSDSRCTEATQTAADAEQTSADKAAKLKAALAATGNDYPTPALFVKRWNLLTQWAPGALISKFTSQGHEKDPRPIADLDAFDYVGAERTYLQIGSSDNFIEYVTLRDDPRNIGAKERPNSYSITIKGQQTAKGHISPFTQICLWEILSTRSSFTLHSAIQLIEDATRNKPPVNAAVLQNHAEAEGTRLILTKNGESSTCEVEEARSR
jgi:hypothetical protein